MVAVYRKLDVRISITIREQQRVRPLIDEIPEEERPRIDYSQPGGADVAETAYTPFQDSPDAESVRSIVRRARPAPGSQLALLALYSYHDLLAQIHRRADLRGLFGVDWWHRWERERGAAW